MGFSNSGQKEMRQLQHISLANVLMIFGDMRTGNHKVLRQSHEPRIISLYFAGENGKWVQLFIKTCANINGNTV